MMYVERGVGRSSRRRVRACFVCVHARAVWAEQRATPDDIG
jgi:hypothetical protein